MQASSLSNVSLIRYSIFIGDVTAVAAEVVNRREWQMKQIDASYSFRLLMNAIVSSCYRARIVCSNAPMPFQTETVLIRS